MEIELIAKKQLITGEVMMAKARSFGSKAHLEQAQNMKMPSCENLSRIGLTKYMPY